MKLTLRLNGSILRLHLFAILNARGVYMGYQQGLESILEKVLKSYPFIFIINYFKILPMQVLILNGCISAEGVSQVLFLIKFHYEGFFIA